MDATEIDSTLVASPHALPRTHAGYKIYLCKTRSKEKKPRHRQFWDKMPAK
jgi:hypothetical protein